MSDAQTVWKLSVALACTVGAAWMKFCGGVSDDGKNICEAGNRRDADLVRDLLPFMRDGGPLDSERPAMKEGNGATYRTQSGTNILEVDFAYHRLVRDMRKFARDLGATRDGTVT